MDPNALVSRWHINLKVTSSTDSQKVHPVSLCFQSTPHILNRKLTPFRKSLKSKWAKVPKKYLLFVSSWYV